MSLKFLDKSNSEEEIIIFKNEINLNLGFPFSKEQTKNVLINIQKNDWSFKEKKEFKIIKNIANSTIAEYFVNLMVAYHLNVKPLQFKTFCNTKINNKLIPYFTAPGGRSDGAFILNDRIYVVESTIHKNEKSLLRNEIFPCIIHAENLYSKNKNLKCHFLFVSFFNKTNTLIKNTFEKNAFNSYELAPLLSSAGPEIMNILNFEELSHKI